MVSDDNDGNNVAAGISAPRIHVCDIASGNGYMPLPAAQANHVARALRLPEGAALTLFDGRGGEYRACVAQIRKDRVDVEIIAHYAVEREAALPLRLVQALQGGDKMEFTIQKAVELGVREIVPVISRRSVVRLEGERARKRAEHWRQIVVAASEQCGRNRLAEVADIQPLDRWLSAAPRDDAVRVLLSPTADRTAHTLVSESPRGGFELLIGPEGGLDPVESSLALSRGYIAMRLGPRVLRTETAGLAAMAAIHARWGDFI